MYFKFMKRFENLCSIEEGPLNLSINFMSQLLLLLQLQLVFATFLRV
jgi:hypothetical protein